MSLSYEALTDLERQVVVNGCGDKAGWLRVPDFGAFGDACGRHDLSYWQGGTEAIRQAADWLFLQDMLDVARAAPWYRRWWLWAAAWTYYRAVDAGGWLAFDYREVSRGQFELDAAVAALQGSLE